MKLHQAFEQGDTSGGFRATGGGLKYCGSCEVKPCGCRPPCAGQDYMRVPKELIFRAYWWNTGELEGCTEQLSCVTTCPSWQHFAPLLA
mmetsp:Transcript_27128/g.77897  ORF Transcript_27128/g.77897 Transcript_27128/m.77897 type:complete len:89 (-) Transcript_27128:144-410(-)